MPEWPAAGGLVRVEVKANTKKLMVRLTKASQRAVRITKQIVDDGTTWVLNDATLNVRGRVLRVRSGISASQVHKEPAKRIAGGWEGRVGTNYKPLKTHETGKPRVITSDRPGGMLAIPLPAGLTAKGKTRYPGSLRRYDLTLIPREGKPSVLVDENRGPVFTLHRSVKVRRRPWLGPAYKQNKKRIVTMAKRRLGELWKR